MKKGTIGALSLLTGAALGAFSGVAGVGKSVGAKLKDERKMADKHLALYLMMNKWVAVKQEGKHLASYFESKGYKKIAIYGMSYAGERLAKELDNTEIEIKYGIDKNAQNLYSSLDVYSLEDELEEVDVVVVTPIFFFNEIEEELSRKFDCPIVSLEDILYAV